ncbi:hypothetical protein CHARACLAT_004230 [Characodon lateralis]|uniref:Secreted protein n=1 Tax=Characodon lateralis TaxID=208331 RepID=A0ABU7D870_9TELE|nr:hypothetical protein [Characodon lateralis]
MPQSHVFCNLFFSSVFSSTRLCINPDQLPSPHRGKATLQHYGATSMSHYMDGFQIDMQCFFLATLPKGNIFIKTKFKTNRYCIDRFLHLSSGSLQLHQSCQGYLRCLSN